MKIQLNPAFKRFRQANGATEMSVQSLVSVQLLDGVGLVIADVAAVHSELLLSSSLHHHGHKIVLHGHQLLNRHLLLGRLLLGRERRQQLGGWHLRLRCRLHKLLLLHRDGWRCDCGRRGTIGRGCRAQQGRQGNGFVSSEPLHRHEFRLLDALGDGVCVLVDEDVPQNRFAHQGLCAAH